MKCASRPKQEAEVRGRRNRSREKYTSILPPNSRYALLKVRKKKLFCSPETKRWKKLHEEVTKRQNDKITK